MHAARRILAAKRFQKKVFREIIEAASLLEQTKQQQLFNQLRQAGQRPCHMSLFFNGHVPEAFTLVPLSVRDAVYTICAPNGRPYQAWLYQHNHSSHQLLYEENSPSCTVDIALTRDGHYVTINSNSRTSSEVFILETQDLTQRSHDVSPLSLRPREERVEYYVEHAHNRFYILTNLGTTGDYNLMTADGQKPDVWRLYYQPKEGTVLQDMEVYEGGLVLYALNEGVPEIIVLSPEEEEPLVVRRTEFTQIERVTDSSYTSECWPVWLSSPVSPLALTTITPSREVIKHYPEKDDRLCVERKYAVSKDGTQVPMTICYRRDLLRGNYQNPVLVSVYGCYGECVPSGYQPERVPLLERGWVLVYAHTRGGGEKGRRWYYDGMAEQKHNTFQDLYACVQAVHCELSQPHLTALWGRSAGGLAVGMFCNLWPHLVQAAILEVPLVNLCASLSDSASYLASKDKEEFGAVADHICSICPHCCLKPQDYPAMYVSASLHDEIIPFSGVQEYVRRLRKCAGRSKGDIVFDVDKIYCHYNSGNARERARKASLQTCFLYGSGIQLDLKQVFNRF